MSARFLFDLIEPAVLTKYIRQYDNEVLKNNFMLDRYLPDLLNDELEYVIDQQSFQDVDVAEYRAFDTQPRLTGRQGFDRIRGSLAPVSRQIALTEEERLRLRALQSGGAQGRAAQVNQIYADAERMTRAVKARLELAKGQVLQTGKFTLAENGLVMEADFSMPATHKPTAQTTWATNTTDILADLLTWMQLYVDDNGFEPGEMVLSRKILGYMINNNKMKEAAAFAGTTPARINLETVQAILASNGLPPIIVNDTTVRVNGTATRVIAEDKVLFMPPQGVPLGNTHYGITAEALVLAEAGKIQERDAAGIVAVNLRNDNPVQTFTLATAIAVPVLGNPNAIICADVVP
jgi:Phage major capsid protein E